MKHLLASGALAALCWLAAAAEVAVDGTAYTADTLRHRAEGPGTVCTIVRLPDWPLNVYLLEVDMTNPYNTVETVVACDSLGATEHLSQMAIRQTGPQHRPVAACNASFWCVSGNGAPYNQYALGSPWGAVVRNDTTYVNSNLDGDAWNGGPTHTAVAFVNADKRIQMGHYYWHGVYAITLDNSGFYQNINRRCLAGDLALWTQAYGRNRPFENDWLDRTTRGNNHSDNYYLTLDSGSSWNVNGNQTFTVARIVRDADRQTLGNYDACLTAAADGRSKLAQVAVGDRLIVNSLWITLDEAGAIVSPSVRQMVEGNAPVLLDGTLTEHNTIEAYNASAYARTIYGTNADGSRLYMAVVDRSTSDAYGRSAGCSTAQLVQIMRHHFPDMLHAVNFDGGGSAQMFAGGEVVNAPSDGRPRPVATAWMVLATGERDDNVASIAFADYRVRLNAGEQYQPAVWAYNARGEVVARNVDGVVLTCPAALGTTADGVFTAGALAASGVLTATLGNLTATLPVTVDGATLLRGDIDANGMVDVADLNIVLNIILGQALIADWPAADFNDDGMVDVADVNILISIILQQ